MEVFLPKKKKKEKVKARNLGRMNHQAGGINQKKTHQCYEGGKKSQRLLVSIRKTKETNKPEGKQSVAP